MTDAAPHRGTDAPGWYPHPRTGDTRWYWNGDGWAPGAAPPAAAPPAAAPPPPPPPSPVPSPAPGALRLPSGPARVAALVVGGLALGFLAVIAFGHLFNGGSGHRIRTAAPVVPPRLAPPTTAPTPITPLDPSVTALSKLVVRQADVRAGVTVEPLRGGGEVRGQPTLDLCNGRFASESLRTARLQVLAVDALGDAALSTEAVLYESAASTAQAFAELRAVVARCPSTAVPDPGGGPPVSTRFNPVPDGSWPQVATVERLAFDLVSTDDFGQSQHDVAVYLRRGRALLGVYFSQPDSIQPAVAGQTTIPDIGGVFAHRLAALPASVVDG